MRKKLRSVTLAALAVAVVLTFGACSQEGPVDTGSTYTYEKMIHGYVYDNDTNDPIVGAWVVWYLIGGTPPTYCVGSGYTNNGGYYEIWGDTELWERYYVGENLEGYADSLYSVAKERMER
jgi:hypothetical protein